MSQQNCYSGISIQFISTKHLKAHIVWKFMAWNGALMVVFRLQAHWSLLIELFFITDSGFRIRNNFLPLMRPLNEAAGWSGFSVFFLTLIGLNKSTYRPINHDRKRKFEKKNNIWPRENK